MVPDKDVAAAVCSLLSLVISMHSMFMTYIYTCRP